MVRCYSSPLASDPYKSLLLTHLCSDNQNCFQAERKDKTYYTRWNSGPLWRYFHYRDELVDVNISGRIESLQIQLRISRQRNSDMVPTPNPRTPVLIKERQKKCGRWAGAGKEAKVRQRQKWLLNLQEPRGASSHQKKEVTMKPFPWKLWLHAKCLSSLN